MKLQLPNDPGEQIRMKLCLDLLRLSVATVDALGYDAKVYYEKEKRLADMQSHARGVNEAQAVAHAANLKNVLETVLHAAGWKEKGKEN